MSRRSREELRSLMIEAGCELVTRRGLALDPPSLTYANVFQHIEATRDLRLHRSQVHGRIWESQDHYRTDVVISTIRQVLPSPDEIDAFVGRLTLDTDIEIRALIERWVAGSLGTDETGADDYLGFDILVAAQALTHEDSASDARISEAATENLSQRMTRNELRFDRTSSVLGLDFVDDLDMSRDDSIKLLARNASSLIEGIRLMESLDNTAPEVFETVTDGQTPEPIDATTLGLLTFVEELFGMDNEA